MKMTVSTSRLLLAALLVGSATQSAAALNVAATTSNLGMLARVVGGDAVKVTVLAPPDRDPHFLQARPSMMVALRSADLLVSVGAELEVGWLPAALQGASNPKLLPGQPGYFEAAAQVPLADKAGESDRSRGDVHPMGNPHVFMDPVRMQTIARALAGSLARLDARNDAKFRANAEAFVKAVDARIPGWRQAAAGSPGVVLYHKDANYLMTFLGVPVLGYVEPLPGIPPTAQHLSSLIGGLQGKRGAILFTDYQPSQGPEKIASSLKWKSHRLPIEAGLSADTNGWLDMIDGWVKAAASAK
jgi:zinc/manganese transport system substrate-binding protein